MVSWRPFPGREVLLFLVAILTPCLVLVVLSLRTLEQDRQLEEKRASDERRRLVVQFRQELLSRLEHIKVELVLAPAGRWDEAIAFVGEVREGQLLLPWEANPNARIFRESIREAPLSEKLRQAEREENADGDAAGAVQSYREAVKMARRPAAHAYARLLLARALMKAGKHEQSRSEYAQALESPPDLVDEHGILLALYAAPPLIDAGVRQKEIALLVRTLTEHKGWLPPAALYLLRDLADGLASRDLASKLAAQIQDREQAEALRRDFSSLMPLQRSREPVWAAYGEPPWLVSIAPRGGSAQSLAVAVRAHQILARLSQPEARVALAPEGTGEPLGDSFPGLRVTIATAVEPGGASRRTLVVFALAMALAVTLFAGYLLWRDVRRELRLAVLRSQFVASVSHELKTPLTAIRMFTEAMRLDEDLERQTQNQYLDTILQETERLSRLVDNVLEFAKIEQGRKTYHMQPTSLAEVAEAATRAVAYPLAQSGFRLQVTVDHDLPPVPADRDALEQAILNLLSNAMKYSAGSREIGVNLSRDNSEAVIRVVDHGVGIPLEEQTRIFERFYRVHSSENERLPGTGLGLTLVEHIARAHGGSVAVRSKPGEGSTFTIRLPLGKSS